MSNNINLSTLIPPLLKKIRLEKNLSQEDLADIAELDRTYISGVERGIRNITLKTLSSILNALDISTGEFIKRLEQEHEAYNDLKCIYDESSRCQKNV